EVVDAGGLREEIPNAVVAISDFAIVPSRSPWHGEAILHAGHPVKIVVIYRLCVAARIPIRNRRSGAQINDRFNVGSRIKFIRKSHVLQPKLRLLDSHLLEPQAGIIHTAGLNSVAILNQGNLSTRGVEHIGNNAARWSPADIPGQT